MDIIGSMMTPEVLDTLSRYSRDPDPVVRTYATEGLGFQDAPYSIPPIIAACADRDPRVRKASVKALQSIGAGPDIDDPSSILPLLDDPDLEVRKAAIESIGEMAIEDSIEQLSSILLGEDEVLAHFASEALGRIGTKDAALSLIKGLHSPRKPLRKQCIRALGWIHHPIVLEPLLLAHATLKYPDGEELPRSLAAIPGQQVTSRLLAAINDSNITVRLCAIRALGFRRSEVAIEPLKQTFEDWDSDIKRASIQAIGRIGGGKAMEFLRDHLFHRDSSIRCKAIIGLGEMGTGDVVDDLISVLCDKSESARMLALEYLRKINDPRAIASIIPLLRDRKYLVQREAGLALIRIGGLEAEQGIVDALNDQDTKMRLFIFDFLADQHQDTYLKHFEQAIEDPSPEVRAGVVRSLGHFRRNRSALEILSRVLSDNDPVVREAAISSIERIGLREGIPLLLPLIEDQSHPNWFFRKRTISSLAEKAMIELQKNGK